MSVVKNELKRAGKIVTTQATEDVWNFENKWSSDICDCCSNIKRCCWAYWCFPCYLCGLFRRTGDYCCTPIVVPYALMALRTKLRTGFRISGSICVDCILTSCCPCCSALQIEKELESQGL